ncbi:MAG: class I SAM-dependent methyltransferase [Blautia sp.]
MRNKPDDNEFFWNKRSEVYDDQVLKVYKNAYKKTIKRSLPYLDQDKILLDLGCGTGVVTIPLAKHVKMITAIDTSEDMMSRAWGKAEKKKIENIEFCHTDILKLDKEPESFDVITAFNLLLYVKEKQIVLNRIWELLKPGGVFLSATDCLGGNLSSDSVKKYVKTKLHRMPYVSFDTPIGLMRKIQKQGFLVLEIVNLHRNPPNIFIVAQKIEKNK